MTKATLTKTVGTIFSLLLSGLALYFHSNPQLAGALVLVGTNIMSWLHLPTPGTVRVGDLPPQQYQNASAQGTSLADYVTGRSRS